ncbi:MAG: hypothetical protein AAF830_13295 [Pseudomonadota bacterium]
MRALIVGLSGLLVTSCVTDDPIAPVPETGAFSLKLIEINGDQFLSVRKDGSKHIAQLVNASHPNRVDWTREDWTWYADELFPEDEISFDGLRMLRGSNLVPVGLNSPKPGKPMYCMKTEVADLAKFQRRTIRSTPSEQVYDSITMTTECIVHAGLSPTQEESIHLRPNPERFPTRYETVVDLDDDGSAEQRNVRMRNVSKVEVLEFVENETSLSKKQLRQLAYAMHRM